jgi:hypothetical protein
MADFLNNLYSNPNFAKYLIIAIIVLVIVFVLVLLLGKKDKKLEETKRLEKINQDTFKETSEPVKLETNEIKSPEPMTDILLQPQTSEMHYDDTDDGVFKAKSNNIVEPVIPVEPVNMVTEDKTDSAVIPEMPKIEEPIISETQSPILPSTTSEPIKVEESSIKPIEEPDPIKIEPLQNRTNTEVIRLVNDEDEIKIPEPSEVKAIEINPEIIPDKEPEPKNSIPEVKIPEFNFDELEATLDKQYSDKETQEEAPINLNELLNESTKEETKTNNDNDFSFDDNIELPNLKEDTEVKPIEFDNISGESYDIK